MAVNKTEFTLYTANCRGDHINTSYPQAVRVTDIESLRRAVSRDHVSAKYRAGYAKSDTEQKNLIPAHRAITDFDSADGIMLDVDNTPAQNTDDDIPPEKWIYPKDVKAAFPGVPFYVVYSRNHNKQKNRYSPRPRFHVYFAIDAITDAGEFTAQKDKVCAYFPQFDTNAKDAARFFYGVENPQVEFYESEGGQ